MFNVDTKKKVVVNMCGFDGARSRTKCEKHKNGKD